MLDLLRSTRKNIQANLVHLLSGRSLGGVAYLNALCGDVRYGVSASQSGNPSTLPKSSFTLIVVAHEIGHNLGSHHTLLKRFSVRVRHEIGHNLGSHHTHNCVWNGNNTRIDNCGVKLDILKGLVKTQMTHSYPLRVLL